MIITCENCSTRFTLDESLVKPEGSKVRCSQCGHVFIAMPPVPEMPQENVLELDTPEEVDFDAPEETAPDSQDLNFDTEFEEMDFEQDLDFDDTDLSFDAPEDGAGKGDAEDEPAFDMPADDEIPEDEDIPVLDEMPEIDEMPADEVEFETPELEAPDLEMEEDQDFLSFEAPEEEADQTEIPGLEMEPAAPAEPDLSDIDEIEFEDLELQEEEPGDGADIEISFDEDEAASQDLESMSLKMEASDSDDLDFGTEEISFEEDDFAFETEASPESIESEDSGDDDQISPMEGLEIEGLEMEVEDTDDKEIRADDLLEPDLELSFEDDLEMDEIEFDEPADQKEQEPDSADDEAPAFPDLEDFQVEPDPDLLLEDDDAPDTGLEQALEDEKFAEYDQVLDQETEPEEEYPELDAELNDPAVSPPEAQPATEPAPVPTLPVDEEPPTGPLITPAPDTDGGKRRIRKRKGGLGAPVKILMLMFLLIIAAYLICLRLNIPIPLLDQVNIPFVTQAFKPAPPPVAATGPIPNDASTNGRFVTNATAGRLFVVTGNVDNPDKIAYSHIRVRGTLLTKGNKKAATQVIYCGNVISEEDLKSGNISDITQKLSIKEGMQNTNTNIKPGASVRFMLVFSSLPENLTNFTVEVLDYKPAGQK